MTVTVPEQAPVQTTPKRAFRLFLGRFIVDYVETFTGLAVVQLGASFAIPVGVDAWRVTLVQLSAPALAALVSSLRRAWPTIKKWLTGEDE